MPQRDIIQLSGITQPQLSSGSLLVTFNELPYDFGSPLIEVTKNNRITKRQYTNIDNLFSTFLNIGDIVRIAQTTNTNEFLYITRLDYTCDDENGDRGIKESFVTSGSTTGTTFTVTGNSNSYNFEYLVSNLPETGCFKIGTGFAPSNSSGFVSEILTDSSSNVYIGGNYTGYNGTNVTNLVKLTQDGQIDTTFATTTNVNGYIDGLSLQTDGKLLVGGFFTIYSGVSKNRLVRLNTNGTIDNTYTIGSGFNNGVYRIKLKSDGNAIVVGEFTTYNGASAKRIVELNTTGGLVNSFGGVTGGTDGPIWGVDVDSLNRIVIAGNFTTYRGVARRDICRINSDGTIDLTFNPGSGFSGATDTSNYCVRIQSDDKIIVGGTFSNYSGVSVNDLIRLNTDGSIDTSFNIGTGSNSWVEWFDILPDGKLLVVGPFTSWNGSIARRIVKLNTDGSIDTSFSSSGSGPNDNVTMVKYDTLLGKPYFGGTFTTYNALSASHILRTDATGFENIC